MNKRSVFFALAPAVIGVFPLVNSFNNPRLIGLHGADRLQLIAVGWCFGMAFAFLMVNWMAKGK